MVRSPLARDDGREVKHTGDGIMASFASVTEAVQAAIDIQNVLVPERNPVPAPIRRSNFASGSARANRSQTVMTSSAPRSNWLAFVRTLSGEYQRFRRGSSLPIGKLHRFKDRGSVLLKGFVEPTQVYEVLWD